MYKNKTQNNIQKQPYISLQKLGENKFIRGITTLVGFVAGTVGAYQIAKIVSSYSPEVNAEEIQKTLNNTKPIECFLSEEQAETTVNHNSKIEQLYNKRVSQYIKDMPDIQIRSTISTLAHKRGIDTSKSAYHLPPYKDIKELDELEKHMFYRDYWQNSGFEWPPKKGQVYLDNLLTVGSLGTGTYKNINIINAFGMKQKVDKSQTFFSVDGYTFQLNTLYYLNTGGEFSGFTDYTLTCLGKVE